MAYGKPTAPSPFTVLRNHPGATRDEPRTHRATDGWSVAIPLELQVHGEFLHVGSGEKDVGKDGKTVFERFMRRDGQLVIPGTGIKGAVRSVAEAISESCEPTGRGSRCPDSSVCPSCNAFGALGRRGRVSFSDAVLFGSLVDGQAVSGKVETVLTPVAELWNKGKDHGGRRIYQLGDYQEPPRNVRATLLESVPRGTVWRCTLRLNNVTSAEIGLVLHAIGLRPADTDQGWDYGLRLKLGKAKPRCLGATWFVPLEPEVFEGPPGASGGLKHWIRAKDHVRAQLLDAYEDATKPVAANCPQESY